MSYRQLGNCNSVDHIPPPIEYPDFNILNISIEEKDCTNIRSPNVWGQAFWFINHLGSVCAPKIIPYEKREKYWNFIDGLPEMLACGKCQKHARNFVEKHRPYKDIICSTRDNLVRFFVDFHNDVNKRNGKPMLDIESVYSLFSRPAKIQYFRYS